MEIINVSEEVVYVDHFSTELKEVLHREHPKVLCFVYPASEGYYGVQTTADPNTEFRKSRSRKLFPELWQGLRDKDLASVCGLESSFFCSEKGYISGFWKKQDAIDAAKYIARRQKLLEAFNLEE